MKDKRIEDMAYFVAFAGAWSAYQTYEDGTAYAYGFSMKTLQLKWTELTDAGPAESLEEAEAVWAGIDLEKEMFYELTFEEGTGRWR